MEVITIETPQLGDRTYLVHDGAVGVVTMRDGRPFSVGAFTVKGGRIVEMDWLADPERLGQLDEAEPDRQLARGLAHVAGQRPELLEPVRVTRAVADDHEGGRSGVRVARDLAGRGRGARHASHPRAATSTAIASAGTIAAPTHATGDAAGASCSDGIRPS